MIIIKLHELMWQKKVKGIDLAKATNISEATISKLVRGENIDVKTSTINKLCNYFNCRLDDLVEYKPD